MRTQGWVIFRNNSHCPLINVRYGSDRRQECHNVLVLPDVSVQPHIRAYLKIAHLGKCDSTSHANWIDLFKQALWKAFCNPDKQNLSELNIHRAYISHSPKIAFLRSLLTLSKRVFWCPLKSFLRVRKRPRL
jgi:hypothetical protein